MNRRHFLRGAISVMAVAAVLKGRVEEPFPGKFSGKTLHGAGAYIDTHGNVDKNDFYLLDADGFRVGDYIQVGPPVPWHRRLLRLGPKNQNDGLYTVTAVDATSITVVGRD